MKFSVFILLLLLGNSAFPADQNNLSIPPLLEENPTWLRLLHYDKTKKQSLILDEDFFLSKNGRTDPRQELEATIDAFSVPFNGDLDSHPRCRFPARHYWLLRQGLLFDQNSPLDYCPKLKKWVSPTEIKTLGLIEVSGYLGNPASTFGHALLKFNTGSKSGLFDVTLNYGALVPQNEPPLRYMVWGLFGGYQAGFSDSYFYTEDLVYSRSELRDMWEYRIAVNREDLLFLALHSWEVLGKKFKYYFLSKNCAYKLAELLQLIFEEELLTQKHFWYPPVDLFIRIREIDAQRRKSGSPPLISKTIFIPSPQRQIYSKIQDFSDFEIAILNQAIKSGTLIIRQQGPSLSPERYSKLLDALLLYYDYRFNADTNDSTPEKQKNRIEVLQERIGLPPQTAAPGEDNIIPAPSSGFPPIELGLSYSRTHRHIQHFRLNWAPFKYDLESKPSLSGSEIIVFDTSIGFRTDNNDIYFDKLEFLRILNLKSLPVQIFGENRLAWQFRSWIGDSYGKDKEATDFNVSFAPGRAWRWKREHDLYILLDAVGTTSHPYFQFRPQVNFKFRMEKITSHLSMGLKTFDSKLSTQGYFLAKLQYNSNKNWSCYIQTDTETRPSETFGIAWYW